MSGENSEEVMMVADYSPGDNKTSDKENKEVHAETPLSDESNIRMSTDYKEDEKTRLSDNGKLMLFT